MLQDITADVEHYRQCLKSVWSDFAGRFDTDQDWDLCDLFADIGCSIFDSYIAEKYGFPKGKKAKQYQNQYQQSPIKEIMIIPCRGARGCRCRLNSASQVIWENYVHNSESDFFYWVDVYDYDISAADRPFEYFLSQDKCGQYFIFNHADVRVFLDKKT